LILDTNALSAFIDGDAGVGTILLSQQRVAIPIIVLGEFRYGIAGSRHRKIYEEWLDGNLAGFDILPLSEATTLAYAGLRVALKKLGKPIPANDAWIAALSIQHRLPVLTRDEHFDSLPDVTRIGW